MKTRILLVIFTAITTLSFAQTGSWYVGGNVGFNSSKTKIDLNGNKQDGAKQTTWTFAPEFGTFFTDNIQVGLALTMQGSNQENVLKTSTFGGTLYGRNFFGAGTFRPFVGANIGLQGGSAEEGSANVTEYSVSSFGINVNGGFGYALSEKVTAVGSFGLLGFNSYSQKNKNTDIKTITNNFGLDANTLGNRFTIGIYFTL